VVALKQVKRLRLTVMIAVIFQDMEHAFIISGFELLHYKIVLSCKITRITAVTLFKLKKKKKTP